METKHWLDHLLPARQAEVHPHGANVQLRVAKAERVKIPTAVIADYDMAHWIVPTSPSRRRRNWVRIMLGWYTIRNSSRVKALNPSRCAHSFSTR